MRCHLALSLAVVVGCSSTTSPTSDGATAKQDQLADTGLATDIAMPPDAGLPGDTVPSDLAGADLALQLDVAPVSDVAQPDMAQPDLAQPDMTPSDLSLPDSAPPDLSLPDSVPPDMAPPDMAPPDMPSPDVTTMPDAAPPPSWSKPERLDTMSDDEQELQLAVDGKGNVYAAWVEIGSISTEVEVVRRDVSSGIWSKPERLDTMTDDEQDLQLVVDGAGNVYAAWVEVGAISTEVELVRRDVSSGVWSKPERLDTMTDDERDLRLAVDGAGNVYAGWVEVGSISTEVELVRRDVSTGLWSKPERLDTMTDKETELQLAVDGSGNVYAGWVEVGAINTEVELVRRDVSTGTWSKPERLDTMSDDEQDLRLVVDGTGNVYAGWVEIGFINTEVELVRRDVSTGLWSKPERLDTMSDDEQGLRLVVDSGGVVYAGWIELGFINTEVELVRRDVSSGGWSKPERLDTMSDDEQDLQLAAGPAGDLHAGWIELGFISSEIEVVSYPWP